MKLKIIHRKCGQEFEGTLREHENLCSAREGSRSDVRISDGLGVSASERPPGADSCAVGRDISDAARSLALIGCPWCGEIPKLINADQEMWQVICMTPDCVDVSANGSTAVFAVEFWNKRAAKLKVSDAPPLAVQRQRAVTPNDQLKHGEKNP